MAAPVLVNFGAVGGVGFGPSFSNMGMPASRVNGNILIMIATCSNGTARTMAISGGGGGWTVLGTPDVSTNGNSLVAYRLVDGTESSPVISWTGNDNGCGVILQYSGDYTTSPIGNIHQSHLTVINATMTDSGINLASSNSLVLGIVLGAGSPSTISSAPGGSWTQDQVNTAGLGSLIIYDNPSVSTQGSVSPAFSVTIGNQSAKWMAYTIEIQSQAPASEVDITASAALGVSMAASLTNNASIVAAPSLGLSESVALQSFDVNWGPAPALGVSMAAAVQLERDIVAAASLGLRVQTFVGRRNRQPVVCGTT